MRSRKKTNNHTRQYITTTCNNTSYVEKFNEFYNYVTNKKFKERTNNCSQLYERIVFDYYTNTISDTYDYITIINMIQNEFDSLSENIKYVLPMIMDILDETFADDYEDNLRKKNFVLIRDKLIRQYQNIKKARNILYTIKQYHYIIRED